MACLDEKQQVEVKNEVDLNLEERNRLISVFFTIRAPGLWINLLFELVTSVKRAVIGFGV